MGRCPDILLCGDFQAVSPHLPLTAKMRSKAIAENNIATMQAWAGQAASLAKEFAAGELVKNIWTEVEEKLG